MCVFLSVSILFERSRYSDLLRAGWSGDWIPVGARFSETVQTGPGAHPVPIQWVPCLVSRGKAAGRGVNHPLPSSAEVKEKVEL